jgi:Ca2+-binding EF-hand superfamily protein
MLLLGDSLEKAFKEIDIDGSGTLDFSEMKAAFEKAGRSADESKIKIAMDTLDTDRDGVVSLEEFKAIAWKVSTDE